MKIVIAIVLALLTTTAFAQSQDDIARALQKGWPNTQWVMTGKDCTTGLKWLDPSPQPTCDQIATVIATLGPGPVYTSVATIVGRLTDTEYTAIMQTAMQRLQAQNDSRALRILSGSDVVDLNSDRVQKVKQMLVTAGLLTQARADQVFAP